MALGGSFNIADSNGLNPTTTTFSSNNKVQAQAVKPEDMESKDTFVPTKRKEKKNTNALVTAGLMIGAAVATFFAKDKIVKLASGHKIDGGALKGHLGDAGKGIWNSIKDIGKVFKKVK